MLYNENNKTNICNIYEGRGLLQILYIILYSYTTSLRNHGKTRDYAKNSSCHRTTIAQFLNSGKWDDSLFLDTLKCSVIEIIYSEAVRTGNPAFCIVEI